ncbi:MAG: TolB family protein [bacterium]
MKLKSINNWLTRVLLIGLMALVGIGGLCRAPYTTNSNLKLLVGDTIHHSTHNFNPVVSPDGENVYYLSTPIDTWSGSYYEQAGSIYAVKVNGGNAKEILHGMYNNLAISPDGKKLACQSYKKEICLIPESLIVVVSLATGNVESLWISAKEKIRKLVWNSNGNYLYYLTANAINRLYLPDSTEEFVMSISGIAGFDLFNNDSIYLDSTIWYPEIEPTNQRYIIGTGDVFAHKFIMRDIQMETLFTLPDTVMPYSMNWVGQPYWFPNGNTIVFAAAECGGGTPGGDEADIWILENVFEQIEK